MPGPPGWNGLDVSFVASQYSRLVVIITASRLPFGHRSGFRSEIGTNGYFIRRFRRVAPTIRGRNDSSLLAGLASRSNRAKAWNDSAAQKRPTTFILNRRSDVHRRCSQGPDRRGSRGRIDRKPAALCLLTEEDLKNVEPFFRPCPRACLLATSSGGRKCVPARRAMLSFR